MTAPIKKLETSNNHQKLTVEALEKANLELAGARDAYHYIEGQIKWCIDNAKAARAEVSVAREEAIREYVANFYETIEYQSFTSYSRRFSYADVVERVDGLFPDLDTVVLRMEFLLMKLLPMHPQPK